MAFSGLPDDHQKCPDCGENKVYNAATRSYLHVLGICRKERSADAPGTGSATSHPVVDALNMTPEERRLLKERRRFHGWVK